jgi:hypothetical protein
MRLTKNIGQRAVRTPPLALPQLPKFHAGTTTEHSIVPAILAIPPYTVSSYRPVRCDVGHTGRRFVFRKRGDWPDGSKGRLSFDTDPMDRHLAEKRAEIEQIEEAVSHI